MTADFTTEVTRSDRLDEADTDLVKVWVRFVPREGWLPYDTEGLWAEPLEEHIVRVRSIPFLANGIAFGDVLSYTFGEDATRWATGRVQASGHCTVRVLPVPAGPLGGSAEAVHRCFARWSLGGETYSKELPLVALDVPADADLTGIKTLLDRSVGISRDLGLDVRLANQRGSVSRSDDRLTG